MIKWIKRKVLQVYGWRESAQRLKEANRRAEALGKHWVCMVPDISSTCCDAKVIAKKTFLPKVISVINSCSRCGEEVDHFHTRWVPKND